MAPAHPLFTTAHATLCGAGELAAANVSPSRLTSLYPVLPISYRAFFMNFYETHPNQLEPDRVQASYKSLALWRTTVERGVTGTWEEGELDAYEAAEELIHVQCEAIAQELAVLNVQGAYLPYQFGLITRMMQLLANWDQAAVEAAFIAPETLTLFGQGLDRLLGFFELELGFQVHLAEFRRTRPQAQGTL